MPTHLPAEAIADAILGSPGHAHRRYPPGIKSGLVKTIKDFGPISRPDELAGEIDRFLDEKEVRVRFPWVRGRGVPRL